jgi:hypothetical protein
VSAGSVLVQLTCAGCGWAVAGLMGVSNGSTPEEARRDLVRALHWSPDGKHCAFCRTVSKANQPALVPAQARRVG